MRALKSAVISILAALFVSTAFAPAGAADFGMKVGLYRVTGDLSVQGRSIFGYESIKFTPLGPGSSETTWIFYGITQPVRGFPQDACAPRFQPLYGDLIRYTASGERISYGLVGVCGGHTISFVGFLGYASAPALAGYVRLIGSGPSFQVIGLVNYSRMRPDPKI
ncbi:MAG TPA: hypothetical protein VF972_00490 [Actinomycetota bacterium]